MEAAGFPAIATSSGAIADSLGYADGEQILFKELLYMNLATVETLGSAGVKRISMAVLVYRAAYGYLERMLKDVIITKTLNPYLT